MRTIKSTRDIDSLFKTGRRGASSPLVVRAGKTPKGRGPEGRVVFIAGKQLGGAVKRNRSKRVLRAALRRSGLSWPGWDVAIIAGPGASRASAAELDRALTGALGRAGVLGE